jgi:DnaJ-class molecular chaperone
MTTARAIRHGGETNGSAAVEDASGLKDALDHLLDPLDGLSATRRSATGGDDDRSAGAGGRSISGFDDTPWRAQTQARRGENVYVEITLRTFEAQAGAHPVVRFTLAGTCSHCDGSGVPCASCQGTGCVEVERQLRVRVPPGVEDGAQLRVSGEGGVPQGIGVPGDLLLQVHVLSEPRDRPAIRYVALALLCISLAVLARLLFF